MTSDPRQFVRYWLGKTKIEIDERGGLNSPDKRDYQELFGTMVLDYFEMLTEYNKTAEKKAKGAQEALLLKALEEIMSVEMTKRRAEIFNNIKYLEGATLTPLQAFVKAITGQVEPKVVAVFAHFLWQVKRRLEDKEIVFHIMPIIFGKQGGGKSLAVQKLFRPLTNLTLELSLTEVTDPRFYFSLNKAFAVILDEMAGAKKADVEVLKKQISATYNDVRKLGTNMVTKIKQNASFIGTTNRPVSELLFDTTGMRRFYEVKALDLLDWKAINEINYTDLFRGVDERRERGYIEDSATEIAEDQLELVAEDELVVFMQHHHINIEGPLKEIACSVVYETYVRWAETNGIHKPLNAIWFGRKLRNKGLPVAVHQVKSRKVKCYMINAGCELHKASVYDPLAGYGT